VRFPNRASGAHMAASLRRFRDRITSNQFQGSKNPVVLQFDNERSEPNARLLRRNRGASSGSPRSFAAQERLAQDDKANCTTTKILEGDSMENMQELVERLRAQRDEHASAVARINRAIELLGNNHTPNGARNMSSAAAAPVRRTLSLAARRRISLAMKRHHAAVRSRSVKRVRVSPRKKLHWTQTPEGRKKFAAIRAKAHRNAA
jgi:hypothetical protein